MMKLLFAALAGLLFGIGLIVAGMSNPAKVLSFLDLAGVWDPSLALVMGAEGKGMRRLTRESCDVLVSIPMLGQVESLNVSVATGVLLYEAVRQRGRA